MSGILYIVATPIGNLSDITERAIQVLSEVDLIAVEDTRRSRTLLDLTGFDGKLIAYHDFSDANKAEAIIDALVQGDSVALISDAGTPLISDPGYKLVRRARDTGVSIYPIPGVSALTAAISVAGLPTDRFSFEGFLPHKEAARCRRLDSLSEDTRSLVFYESPHRIVASVSDMAESFGEERKIFLAREMTKKFEQHFYGNLAACRFWLQSDSQHTRGEFVLVVAGASDSEVSERVQAKGLRLVKKLRTDVSLKRAVALAAEISGARKNDLYSAALADESSD